MQCDVESLVTYDVEAKSWHPVLREVHRNLSILNTKLLSSCQAAVCPLFCPLLCVLLHCLFPAFFFLHTHIFKHIHYLYTINFAHFCFC